MNNTVTHLPDVASNARPQHANNLNWVGMEKIAIPIMFPVTDQGSVGVSAYVDVYVSLDTGAKGIHMSRLYLKLQELLAGQALSFDIICTLLKGMLESQKGASNNARICLTFDLPLVKNALLSANQGYQSYSVTINQELINGRHITDLEIDIPYSSTCPCSASLARQLISSDIEQHFAEETLNKSELIRYLMSEKQPLATPHNQRSFAYIKLTLEEHSWPPIPELIMQLEQAIGTPVQTAVKREDEQAFARLNGENLMFCEDAARKLDVFLNKKHYIADYWFKVEHQESLHAHNAVVIHQKLLDNERT